MESAALSLPLDVETVSRTKRGNVLHSFQSGLPGGSRTTSMRGGLSILDCVYQQSMKTYYVIDIVCWKNYSLYDCNTEFRLFWASSKLQEVGSDLLTRSDRNEFPISLVPFEPCSANSIKAAYSSNFGFEKDGLLFFNKEARYQFGSTPLVLRWRCGATSDAPAEGGQKQYCVWMPQIRPFILLRDFMSGISPVKMFPTGRSFDLILKASFDPR